jgi:hypothetical protein
MNIIKKEKENKSSMDVEQAKVAQVNGSTQTLSLEWV